MNDVWFVYDPGTEDYNFFSNVELALDYLYSCLDYWQEHANVKTPDLKLMKVHYIIEDGKVKEIE